MTNLPTDGPLSLRAVQAFHSDLDQRKGFDLDLVRNVAYLTEELGEVASAARRLQHSTNEEERKRLVATLGEELADCLAYLAKLANYAAIDLEQHYRDKMGRNLDRHWR